MVHAEHAVKRRREWCTRTSVSRVEPITVPDALLKAVAAFGVSYLFPYQRLAITAERHLFPELDGTLEDQLTKEELAELSGSVRRQVETPFADKNEAWLKEPNCRKII